MFLYIEKPLTAVGPRFTVRIFPAFIGLGTALPPCAPARLALFFGQAGCAIGLETFAGVFASESP